MTGTNRIAKSSPNVFPRRLLVDPEKGEQRSFIRGASHGLENITWGASATSRSRRRHRGGVGGAASDVFASVASRSTVAPSRLTRVGVGNFPFQARAAVSRRAAARGPRPL